MTEPSAILIVMLALCWAFWVGLCWELLCADDSALMANCQEEVIGKLNLWKDSLERKGLG